MKDNLQAIFGLILFVGLIVYMSWSIPFCWSLKDKPIMEMTFFETSICRSNSNGR